MAASLGLGAGWMREEFDAVGQSVDDRGGRLDKVIDVLRALWTGEPVTHVGRHFRFNELSVRLAPPRPLPILIGDLAGERAVEMRASLALTLDADTIARATALRGSGLIVEPREVLGRSRVAPADVAPLADGLRRSVTISETGRAA